MCFEELPLQALARTDFLIFIESMTSFLFNIFEHKTRGRITGIIKLIESNQLLRTMQQTHFDNLSLLELQLLYCTQVFFLQNFKKYYKYLCREFALSEK